MPASLNSQKGAGKLRNEPFIVGKSPQIRSVLDLAQRYAVHDITVLITGETGTGKDVIARYVHSRSRRASQPFVACNLASMPETLVESELFGYSRGAFTGADKDKKGFLEVAQGGTLFLDEIGELTPTLQVKLLRLLENHEYYRLGESIPRTADVRIVAATNRDLETDIIDKHFRNDLYYRLNTARVVLPPLREHKEDIPLLTQHFVQGAVSTGGVAKEVSSSVDAVLSDYSWPGNIRELKNVLESAVMVSDNHLLFVGDLPMHLQRHAVRHRGAIGAKAVRTIDEAELNLIRKTLQSTNGDKVRAADQLGISTRTLYRRLVKFGVLETA